MLDDPDFDLRRAGLDRVRDLSRTFDDVIPIDALRAGFRFDGHRVSFGSFYTGVFRPSLCRGPAAVSLTTTPLKLSGNAPYDDGYDEATGSLVYHYRSPRQPTATALRAAEVDNRALRAAHELTVPLIYFHGIAPGQCTAVAPVFVTEDDPARRLVRLEAALPVADTTAVGLVSGRDLRAYATREALVRLHQHRFRVTVLHAYRQRCAVCALREAALLQAAHIIDDRDPHGGDNREWHRAVRDSPPRVRPKPDGHRPARRCPHLSPPARGGRRPDAANWPARLPRLGDPQAATRRRPSRSSPARDSVRAVSRRRVNEGWQRRWGAPRHGTQFTA
jgi:putative restriction endonuclease